MAPAWAASVEGSALARALRESDWLYPAVEATHIAGFVLVAGAAILFDLRLLGLGRAQPLEALARQNLRLALGLFLTVVAPTGLLLFATQATALVDNRIFWLKLALIAVAGANAAVYRVRPSRVAGGVSLGAWLMVIVCGRWLAY
jgi:hypothetical protein